MCRPSWKWRWRRPSFGGPPPAWGRYTLDNALRLCLEERFPEIEGVRLSDYRVSVVGAADGTGAQVKVLVEAADGLGRWAAERTSSNIIEASFEALCETAATGIERGRSVLASSNRLGERAVL